MNLSHLTYDELRWRGADALADEILRLRAELLIANAEQERLENQLDSVRSELVATCARMEAWEDVIDDARDNLSAFLPFDLP